MAGQLRVGNRAIGACLVAAFACGCTSMPVRPNPTVPIETQKVSLPEYVVEPPDILQIDLMFAIPKGVYKVQALDTVSISVEGTIADDPIAGAYSVGPDGAVNLGGKNGRYGSVTLHGLTLSESKLELEKHLKQVLKQPVVTINALQTRAPQVVRGTHLVRPDGTVSLGSYGSVYVAGMTLVAVKAAIQERLGQTLRDPEVIVDVVGYNSKVIYVIYDFGGAGQQIVTLPATGNDTVLSAVGQVNGLSGVSDPDQMFIARPTESGQASCILPVDWHAITQSGRPETNYQLMPGDRLYVKSYQLVSFDVRLARLLTPVERIFGVTLLGSSTIRELTNSGGNTTIR